MTSHTFDLMNPSGMLGQAGLLSPNGFDERQPIEQLRREQLKNIAIEKGFEVTDSHRKDDILAVLRSGIRMRQPTPPPALPQHQPAPDAPDPPTARAPIHVSAADEESARESTRSELRSMPFMKLKWLAKSHGIDCPGGMTKAKKLSMIEDLLKKIEADG